jgi:hypothetical protein
VTISRSILGVMMLLACGACGGSATGPSPAEVTGSWSYTHSASGGGTTCSEVGTINLQANDSRIVGDFSGRGGCQGAAAAFDYVKSGGAFGRVIGDSIEITLGSQLESCLYRGRFAGGATSAQGSVICTPVSGAAAAREGSWGMSRITR